MYFNDNSFRSIDAEHQLPIFSMDTFGPSPYFGIDPDLTHFINKLMPN